MAQPKLGKNIELFIGERGVNDISEIVAFATEHSIETTWDKELIVTKSRNIQVGGTTERTISVTYNDYYAEDGKLSITQRLEAWGDAETELNISEVDVTKVEEGEEIEVPQFIGSINSLSQPRPAEGGIEVSAEFTITEKVVGKEVLDPAFVQIINESKAEYESIQGGLNEEQ